MKKKDNTGIEIGMLVEVPEPRITDIHNNGFVGTIEGFRGDNVLVRDMDGDSFEIEPIRLTITE